MRNRFLLLIVCFLATSFGMIFWLDDRIADKQRVLGEKVVDSEELMVNSEQDESSLISANEGVTQENSSHPWLAEADNKTIKQNDDNLDATKKIKGSLYQVIKIVDGDTIDVQIDDEIKRIRLIGINTPESVDPRKPVECFGKEATEKLTSLLSGEKVYLASDDTQSDKDIYGRLLRYVWDEDGFLINEEMIKQGYAYEYTYKTSYQYQNDFKLMQRYAQEMKLGLWADGACEVEAKIFSEATKDNSALPENEICIIKGNISFESGEKIYHTPDCNSYSKTKIDLEKGEKYFCSENEAVEAGWRKAQNCP